MGTYIVIEGPDGVGKSTAQRLVAERLQASGVLGDRKLLLTHSPGCTPLGAHIRKLVKTPQLIDPAITMDELSRQMLYIVDAVNLIRTVLEPALEGNQVVLADRTSFISAVVYGLASGVNALELNQLLHLVTPPKPDKLFVLQCPWRDTIQRSAIERDAADAFDSRPAAFLDEVDRLYNSLLSGPPELIVMINYSVSLDDVVFVDASGSPETVAELIVQEMLPLLNSASAAPQ